MLTRGCVLPGAMVLVITVGITIPMDHATVFLLVGIVQVPPCVLKASTFTPVMACAFRSNKFPRSG